MSCLPVPVTTLGKEEENLLRLAISELALSARAYYQVLKISRTIADLEAEET